MLLHRYKGPPAAKKKSNIPLIIGAAAGAVVLLIAIAIIIYYIVRRRRHQREADNDLAPFPGPAMSGVSSPRLGFSPRLPSTLSTTPGQPYMDSADISHSRQSPSQIQSDFEQQYAQMHSRSYSQRPYSHSQSMSDSSIPQSQGPKMPGYAYEPLPLSGQPARGFQSNRDSPYSSPSVSPPMRPMQLSRGEQNPFQSEAEYAMLQQQDQPGYMRGGSYAGSKGGNPFD